MKPRTEVVKVRMTKAERRALRQLAVCALLGSASATIRFLVRQQAERERGIVVRTPPTDRALELSA